MRQLSLISACCCVSTGRLRDFSLPVVRRQTCCCGRSPPRHLPHGVQRGAGAARDVRLRELHVQPQEQARQEEVVRAPPGTQDQYTSMGALSSSSPPPPLLSSPLPLISSSHLPQTPQINTPTSVLLHELVCWFGVQDEEARHDRCERQDRQGFGSVCKQLSLSLPFVAFPRCRLRFHLFPRFPFVALPNAHCVRQAWPGRFRAAARFLGWAAAGGWVARPRARWRWPRRPRAVCRSRPPPPSRRPSSDRRILSVVCEKAQCSLFC